MKQRASLGPAQNPVTISKRDIKNDTAVHMCRSQGHGLWGSLKKQRPRKRVFKQTGSGEVTSTLLIYIHARNLRSNGFGNKSIKDKFSQQSWEKENNTF